MFVQDQLISTSLPVIELIDAIAPGSVKWDMVKRVERGVLNEDEKLNNAKYKKKISTTFFFLFPSSFCLPSFNIFFFLPLPGTQSHWLARSALVSTPCQTIWWKWIQRWCWHCLPASWGMDWKGVTLEADKNKLIPQYLFNLYVLFNVFPPHFNFFCLTITINHQTFCTIHSVKMTWSIILRIISQ